LDAVRALEIGDLDVSFWREFQQCDLPLGIRKAVDEVVTNCEYKFPARTTLRGKLRRVKRALKFGRIALFG
jgi:hypothetical protein